MAFLSDQFRRLLEAAKAIDLDNRMTREQLVSAIVRRPKCQWNDHRRPPRDLMINPWPKTRPVPATPSLVAIRPAQSADS